MNFTVNSELQNDIEGRNEATSQMVKAYFTDTSNIRNVDYLS